jgi:hypothetical protein
MSHNLDLLPTLLLVKKNLQLAIETIQSGRITRGLAHLQEIERSIIDPTKPPTNGDEAP